MTRSESWFGGHDGTDPEVAPTEDVAEAPSPTPVDAANLAERIDVVARFVRRLENQRDDLLRENTVLTQEIDQLRVEHRTFERRAVHSEAEVEQLTTELATLRPLVERVAVLSRRMNQARLVLDPDGPDLPAPPSAPAPAGQETDVSASKVTNDEVLERHIVGVPGN